MFAGAAIFAVTATAPPALAERVPLTARVSLDSADQQADGNSYHSAVSADGRFVAFVSSATNLVPGDTNGRQDVFVRDRVLGTTERVSVSSAEVEATSDGVQPSISADGRFVAFASDASNLAPADLTGHSDVFVRDRLRGATARISLSRFGSDADDDSFAPAISADGRTVAFLSQATDLVAGDQNARTDVFVVSAATGSVELASVGSGGPADDDAFAPALSDDGRAMVWASRATTLVPGSSGGLAQVYARDRSAGTTTLVSTGSAGTGDGESGLNGLAVSADGARVAFSSDAGNLVPGDGNGARDIFVRDIAAATTSLVSVHSSGAQGDIDSGYIRLDISADGRFVAFASAASTLVDKDTNGFVDCFVHELSTGTTQRVSLNIRGRESARGGVDPALSADGRIVTFHSLAPNLVLGDSNRALDVFVRVLA
ncbi:MAG: PD40 domain-containing protein [Geodermatophilaceae bacterium]|nr:PD40 domain-containing protein [Geodermatophilaceae bacterium]